MNATQRIPRSLSSGSTFQCLNINSTSTQQIRGVSSFRRTQKALRVQPHDSFKANTTNADNTSDHIIYNPPSSAPSVYHTPLKFLPANDPRRRLHSLAKPSSSSSASPSAATPAQKLPPTIRPIKEKKYHLSAADVEEIRRLRAEDPRQWTRMRLAEKFGCSQFFVSLCGQAPEVAEERKRELEEIKKRWGRAKKEAREDRQRRKELWGRE